MLLRRLVRPLHQLPDRLRHSAAAGDVRLLRRGQLHLEAAAGAAQILPCHGIFHTGEALRTQ